MQMSKWKKWLIGLLAVAAVVTLIVLLTRSDGNFEKKYVGHDLTEDVEGFSRADTSYDSYLLKYDDTVKVPVNESSVEAETTALHDENSDLILIPAGAEAKWTVTVAIEGKYGIDIDYFVPAAYEGTPKLSLMLNEAELFDGSAEFVMPALTAESGVQELEKGKLSDAQAAKAAWEEAAAAAEAAGTEAPAEPETEKMLMHTIQRETLNGEDGNEIQVHLEKGTYTFTIKAADTDIAYDKIEFRSTAARPAQEAAVELTSAVVVSEGSETSETDVRVTGMIDGIDDSEKAVKDYTHTEGLYTRADSEVTMTVNIPEAGYYNILIDYYTVSARGVDIERELLINGETPFEGAKTLCFSRMFTDKARVRVTDNGAAVYDGEGVAEKTENGVKVTKNGEVVYEGAGEAEAYTIKQDNQGNDIRPSQVEYFGWQRQYCRDDMGYESEPYQFYFEKGENTITLKATNEPMIIGAVTVKGVEKTRDYAAYAAANTADVKMTKEGEEYIVQMQGEDAYLRSTPSLYPKYDRSSPATEPYSVDKTKLNYIGGDSWNKPNEWIEWKFEVPEDGYYNITVKARQQYQRGAISCRSVYIDGEIPFEEVRSVEFSYNTEWKMYTLQDENGAAYRFYLTKGEHTIRLEATLGAMGNILKEMENSIFRLNMIYRKILVLTGVNPDRFRDYDIKGKYPEVIEAMDLEYRRLYKLVDDTVAVTGQKSDRVAVAQTLAVQLEQFVGKNERITESFSNFKDNITSLGTAMQNMSETKLDIDMIIVSGEKAKLPAVNEGFFAKLGHEIRSCVTSFFVDYNSLGDIYDENDDNLIEVWIVTGRDQSTILKTMIDDDFTPNYKTADGKEIHVNVKLVVADTLLTAVVAGNGPDVVLSLGSWFPVNYAMRHAVEDLTQFSDYEQVVSDFEPSALVAMTYRDYEKDTNGNVLYNEDGSLKYHDGIYALPETQEYNLLFYRTDVLEEYGLSVPNTWDELIAMMPTLQGNNLTVGIPYPDIAVVDMSVLNSMIYQNGGTIYDDEGMTTEIDNESGVKAFKLYTSLYNDYGLPTVYDFVSRFRSGEMPIGIVSYTAYNTLAVSAPEIRGLWDFALLPGTYVTDEETGETTLDRSVHAQGLCCMMIATDNETIKQNAWTFMKWWISSETQVRFGREIESVLGSSARYATANKKALTQLAWNSSQLAILQEQQSWTVGFREVAGGYSTTRHMTNAIRKVINDKDDARETVMNYAKTINEEIKIKRQEFNLPTE